MFHLEEQTEPPDNGALHNSIITIQVIALWIIARIGAKVLPQQNLSDQWCHFQDKFSQLRMVLENIEICPEPPGKELSEYVFKNSVR